MAKASAWMVQAVLRLLFPASGRHRAADPPRSRRARRVRRRRRHALWLASVGVDAGPQRINGARVVTAR